MRSKSLRLEPHEGRFAFPLFFDLSFFLYYNKYMTTITIRISEEEKRLIKASASLEVMSMTQYIIQSVKQHRVDQDSHPILHSTLDELLDGVGDTDLLNYADIGKDPFGKPVGKEIW